MTERDPFSGAPSYRLRPRPLLITLRYGLVLAAVFYLLMLIVLFLILGNQLFNGAFLILLLVISACGMFLTAFVFFGVPAAFARHHNLLVELYAEGLVVCYQDRCETLPWADITSVAIRLSRRNQTGEVLLNARQMPPLRLPYMLLDDYGRLLDALESQCAGRVTITGRDGTRKRH